MSTAHDMSRIRDILMFRSSLRQHIRQLAGMILGLAHLTSELRTDVVCEIRTTAIDTSHMPDGGAK